MSVVQSITITDNYDRELTINLCGRKGHRYLERGNWRTKVNDKVKLENVAFIKYGEDSRGDSYDRLYITINGSDYCIGKQYSFGGWDNSISKFEDIDDLRKLGQIFDQIKEGMDCEDDTDDTTKDTILQNHRLLKILDKGGLVDLARDIDSLNADNTKIVNEMAALKLKINQIESVLENEKKRRVDEETKNRELNITYRDFKDRIVNHVKTAINDFKL